MAREIRRSKRMSISHADFFRTFATAFKDYEYQLAETGAIIQLDHGRRVRIALGAEKELRIASLQLPSTEVSFTFEAHNETDVDTFLEHFDTHFRRGGG